MIEEYIIAFFSIPKGLYESLYSTESMPFVLIKAVPINYIVLLVSLIISFFISRQYKGGKKYVALLVYGLLIYSTQLYWMKL